MKGMETLQDLIEEAKLRTVWWGLCIFAVSYFLTHTSKSMWMNIPISFLIVFGLRILFNEVEFHWKVRSLQRKTNLSHLEKKQLSVNDFRLTTLPPPPKRKRKIDSPIIEAAIEDFVNKLLQDFVTDLWYSAITPDKEAPELIHAIVMDVLADVSGRVKEINLVELLTRDVVNLIGDHIDLFRRNQTLIGVDVMKTLSSEERDERLKHQLRASKEIHPALVSPDCEYKVLQRLVSGVLAVALRPREAQSPLIRCIARELLTCLVMQPLINLASPEYINELIEYIYLAMKDEGLKQKGDNQSHGVDGQMRDHVVCTDSQYGIASMRKNASLASHVSDSTLSRYDNASESLDASSTSHDESLLYRSAEWARPLEAATQRRTEVLMPENLENMWTKGRNYKKKVQKASAGVHALGPKGSEINSTLQSEDTEKKLLAEKPEYYTIAKNKDLAHAPSSPIPDSRTISEMENAVCLSREPDRVESFKEVYNIDEFNDTTSPVASGNKKRLKRSNSTPDLVIQPNMDTPFTSKFRGPVISEFYSPDSGGHNQLVTDNSASDIVLSSDGNTPKLKCRVIGAYFEKLGSKSFAVYLIAVTDTENNTWFVKRRYRNFERLHRHLKDIPNYTLQLPPKRIFSSSTEDKFVRQRCIQLDKYLQDLLSIANVAEQHEVWDFLSVSSKNYSFGKSPSVMRTLAVNVDDAVDDIVRQVKGVSGGLMRKVVGPSSTAYEQASLISAGNLSRKEDEIKNVILRQQTADSAYSFSDDEECDQAASNISQRPEGWQSDNKLKSKDILRFGSDKDASRVKSESISSRANLHLEDLTRVPQEWTPPNLSVPVLNLVDNIFQLKRRGWLRRQVFWISKQIVQLMMEDAIDDWLLRQIHWFRRDDIIAQGIRWVQDVLWPDGIFFLPLTTASVGDDCEPNTRGLRITSHSASNKVSKQGSFEEQIEAVRRASDVRKILFDEVPIALVSLIGHNQYKRCAHDIYYFLQSKVCMKQLTYGILELVLVSIFPELREVVLDMHEKMRDQSV